MYDNTPLDCVQVLVISSLWTTHTNHHLNWPWHQLPPGHRLMYRNGWAPCSWVSMPTGCYFTMIYLNTICTGVTVDAS